jgi:hypothetical protein
MRLIDKAAMMLKLWGVANETSFPIPCRQRA